jgi:hypothetical protein
MKWLMYGETQVHNRCKQQHINVHSVTIKFPNWGHKIPYKNY